MPYPNPPASFAQQMSLDQLRQLAYGSATFGQAPAVMAARVADGLKLDAKAHDRMESALAAWFSGGAMGPFVSPVDLPDDVMAQLGATLSAAVRSEYLAQQPLAQKLRGVRMPTAAERLSAAPGVPLARSEGAAQKADDRPKWKKKGWVGPGGARATAERRAVEAGHPPDGPYAKKIYSAMTGKSTRSGKPIPEADATLYRACRTWAERGPRQLSQRGAGDALARSCADYTAADHHDAAAHHQRTGSPLAAWAHAHAAASLTPGGR